MLAWSASQLSWAILAPFPDAFSFPARELTLPFYQVEPQDLLTVTTIDLQKWKLQLVEPRVCLFTHWGTWQPFVTLWGYSNLCKPFQYWWKFPSLKSWSPWYNVKNSLSQICLRLEYITLTQLPPTRCKIFDSEEDRKSYCASEER